MKVFIQSDAVFCHRRRLDANRLARYCRTNGHELTDHPSEADRTLLLTCGVVEFKVQEALQAVRELSEASSELVVLGCLPGVAPVRLEQIFTGESLPTSRLEEIDRLFPGFKVPFADIPDAHQRYSGTRERDTEGWKFLRIAHGCSSKCTYCSVRAAVGPLKSKPLDRCAAEYRGLLEQGCRHLILTAEDTAAYGSDIGLSLTDLLSKFEEIEQEIGVQNVQWDIENLNPAWMVQKSELVLGWLGTGRVTRLKFDIQSGSARILKLMNRRIDLDEVDRFLEDARRVAPKLEICSQFIVGFPSESESDFERSFRAMRDWGLKTFKVFKYCNGEGAPSRRLPGQVPADVVEQRIRSLVDYFSPRDYLCSFDEDALTVIRLPL